jgi:hypothetical protein
MKAFLHKYTAPMFSALTAVVVLLLVASTLLYMEKAEVKTQNRVLILQNDSILSENIRLRNTLQQEAILPTEKTKLSLSR